MAHTHYKGTGKVHSFRGLLADEEQRRIRIQGPVGAIAWRITAFQIMPNAPGYGSDSELVTKIYREEQTSITNTVDLDEDELLAVAYYQDNTGGGGMVDKIIFDNALFSRNIFVSFKVVGGSQSSNYYIELEEVKVSAAGMAQLAVAAARRTIG